MDARSPRASLAAALLAMLAVGIPRPIQAQTLRTNFWHPDGAVQAVAYGNNTVYIAGSFRKLGAPTGNASFVDPTTGMPLIPYLDVEGQVDAVISDGAGGWFLGGSFLSVQGAPTFGLAHIDASGKVLPWSAIVNGSGPVTCMALSGTTLYFGGPGTFFSNSGTRNFLGAVDTGTGSMTTFSPMLNGAVNALLLANGKLYVGGQFTTVNGLARHQGAAFNLPLQTLSTWDPLLTGPPPLSVNAIGMVSNRVYLGGSFQAAGLTMSPSLVAVDTTTGHTAFASPGVTGTVNTMFTTQLTVSPFTQTIWIGGDFTQVGSTSRRDLAAIDLANNVLPFDPNPNNVVRAIGVATDASGNATAIDAGGDFTAMGGTSVSYLASLTPSGTATVPTAQPNNAVTVIALAPNGLIAGGSFTSILIPRIGLAALDATSGAPTPFISTSNGIQSMALYGNSLYVAGHAPISVGGQTRPGGAGEVNAVTGAVTPWNPPIDSICGLGCVTYLNAITRSGNAVYVGGLFQTIGTQVRHDLAALDPVTGQALPFNANPDSVVNCLLVKQSDTPPYDAQILYAGGSFFSVNQGLFPPAGGQPRNGIAAFDPTTGKATSWMPDNGLNPATVRCLARASGPPFGTPAIFESVAGAPNASVLDEGTAATEAVLSGGSGAVNSLAYSAGSLYVGGSFSSLAASGPNLARFDFSSSSTWTTGSWSPAPNPSVNSIAINGTTVFVGGSFSTIAGSSHHPCFAAISNGTVTAVPTEVNAEAPSVLRAEPNPFHRDTEVWFALPKAEPVRAGVYDVSGRLVRDLHEGLMSAGEHELTWSGENTEGQEAARGIYFLRVDADRLHQTAKVVLLR